MSRKTFDHHHQYHRLNPISKIYRCIIPKCRHNINRDLLVGREAACYLCGAVFEIKEKHLINHKIHCMECKKKSKPPATPAVKPAVNKEKIQSEIMSLFKKKEKDGKGINPQSDSEQISPDVSG